MLRRDPFRVGILFHIHSGGGARSSARSPPAIICDPFRVFTFASLLRSRAVGPLVGAFEGADAVVRLLDLRVLALDD